MSKLTAEFKGLRRALRSKKSNGVTVLQIQQEFFFRTETKEAVGYKTILWINYYIIMVFYLSFVS